MILSKAVEKFRRNQMIHLKPMTKASYEYLLKSLTSQLSRKNIKNIRPEDILKFLSKITDGQKSGTKRLRYNQVKAFFNYCIRDLKVNMSNPCATQEVRKAFRIEKTPKKPINSRTIEKVFSLVNRERDRLIIDLMGKVGLEASEILSLKPSNIRGRRVILGPNRYSYLSGRLAQNMKRYIKSERIKPNEAIFKLTYPGLRMIVKRYADMIHARITPNELRKYAGLLAYKKGIPIEFISKIIYRHSSLDTTMEYLRLSYAPKNKKEIYKWMESLDR